MYSISVTVSVTVSHFQALVSWVGEKAQKSDGEKNPEGFFGAPFFALAPQIIERLKEAK